MWQAQRQQLHLQQDKDVAANTMFRLLQYALADPASPHGRPCSSSCTCSKAGTLQQTSRYNCRQACCTKLPCTWPCDW
jgi:hypothetical protein